MYENNNNKKKRHPFLKFIFTATIVVCSFKLGHSVNFNGVSVTIDHLFDFVKGSPNKNTGTDDEKPDKSKEPNDNDNYQHGTGKNNKSGVKPSNKTGGSEQTLNMRHETASPEQPVANTSGKAKNTGGNTNKGMKNDNDSTQKEESKAKSSKQSTQAKKTNVKKGGARVTSSKTNTDKVPADASGVNETENAEVDKDTDEVTDKPSTSCEFTTDTTGKLKLVVNNLESVKGVQMTIRNEADSSDSGYTGSVMEISNTPDAIETEDEKWLCLKPGSYTIVIYCLLDTETTELKFVDDLVSSEEETDDSGDSDGSYVNEDSNSSSEEEDISELPAPMLESYTATVKEYETDSLAYFRPEHSFIPQFDFVSEDGVDGVLQILDSDKNVLYSVYLYYDANGYDSLSIEGDAQLNEGECYYLCFNTESDDEYSEDDEYLEDEDSEEEYFKYDFRIFDANQEEEDF